MRPSMPCDSCRGTGRRTLTMPYAITYKLVPLGWADTGQILAAHPADSVARTALINRLNQLVRWQLVERSGSGRQVLWRKK